MCIHRRVYTHIKRIRLQPFEGCKSFEWLEDFSLSSLAGKKLNKKGGRAKSFNNNERNASIWPHLLVQIERRGECKFRLPLAIFPSRSHPTGLLASLSFRFDPKTGEKTHISRYYRVLSFCWFELRESTASKPHKGRCRSKREGGVGSVHVMATLDHAPSLHVILFFQPRRIECLYAWRRSRIWNAKHESHAEESHELGKYQHSMDWTWDFRGLSLR